MTTQIVLNEIPDGMKVPGVPVEVDESGASSGVFVLPKRILLIGGRTTGGTVAASIAANTPIRITGDGQGVTYHGTGSHVAQMVEVARSFSTVGRRVELWTMGVSDSGSGVAATGDIALSGTATSALPLIYLVGGRRISVPVSIGDTGAEIATAAAALDHDHTAVTAADGTGSIDFTARNDGPGGNDISIVVLQRPAGITATITAMASGATNPDLAPAIAAIAAYHFTHIVCAFNDDGSADDLEEELVRRAGALVDQRGILFLGYRGSLANAIIYGDARNSQYTSVGHVHNGRSSPWEIATWLCMADAVEDDPARPRNGISGATRGFDGRGSNGITPMAATDVLQAEDYEMLLDAGVTPLHVDEFGNISVVRMVTTYKLDAAGAATDLYLDITTPRTLAALIYTWKTRLKRLYPRAKKDEDGGPRIANVVTPSELRSVALGLFDGTWVPEGWVQGSKRSEFEDQLVVESDSNNVNQFNIRLPPNIIPGAHIFATQFVLKVG